MQYVDIALSVSQNAAIKCTLSPKGTHTVSPSYIHSFLYTSLCLYLLKLNTHSHMQTLKRQKLKSPLAALKSVKQLTTTTTLQARHATQ